MEHDVVLLRLASVAGVRLLASASADGAFLPQAPSRPLASGWQLLHLFTRTNATERTIVASVWAVLRKYDFRRS